VSGEPIRVLLGLAPTDEQAIEELLYADARLSIVAGAGSASELAGLASRHAAEAVLLSHDLRGLDAGEVARLRARGLRTVGLALTDAAGQRLGELDVDAVARPPLSPEQLLERLREPVRVDTDQGSSATGDTTSSEPARNGNVLAVLGSRGTPGSSEVALSLAALVAQRWRTLLVECDGDGGPLAVRLDADPQQGSLLGLARALQRDDPERGELLSRWLVGGERGWPQVLLGVPDPERQLSEVVTAGAVQTLLAELSARFALVVCDLGQRLSRGSEPDAAVRLHRDVLVCAEAVILVLGWRQEQLHAGFRQLQLLLDELSVPGERIRVVVNGQGAPGAATSADTASAISHELAEHGLSVQAWLPWDARALRGSVRLGLPLALARPRGRYATRLRRLVDATLVPTQQPERHAPPSRLLLPPAGRTGRAEEVALPWRR